VSVPVGAIDTGAREEDDVDDGISERLSVGVVVLTALVVIVGLLAVVAVKMSEDVID